MGELEYLVCIDCVEPSTTPKRDRTSCEKSSSQLDVGFWWGRWPLSLSAIFKKSPNQQPIEVLHDAAFEVIPFPEDPHSFHLSAKGVDCSSF